MNLSRTVRWYVSENLAATEIGMVPSLEDAKSALTRQKAVIVTLAKARNFEAMPTEHMRLRQLERLVQSLTNTRR